MSSANNSIVLGYIFSFVIVFFAFGHRRTSSTIVEMIMLFIVSLIAYVAISAVFVWLKGIVSKAISGSLYCKHGVKGAVADNSLCAYCYDEIRASIPVNYASNGVQRKVVPQKFDNGYQRWSAEIRTESYLRQMDPIEFEKLACTLFERMGFIAEMTPRTGDNGVDAFLFKGEKKAILQCKRVKNGVGEPVLRDLFGTMHATGATWAYLVTTGNVSNQARAWVVEKPIELIEMPRLIQLLEKYFPSDSIVPPNFVPITGKTEACPSCGRELRFVRGRKGRFIGCSGYPKCRYTRDVILHAPWKV